MSYWTRITASIAIETMIESPNVKTVVEEIMQYAPEITGSERNVEIFINTLDGYSTYTTMDCHYCPFGHTRVVGKKGGFSCKAPEEYECKEGKYKNCVVITVVGSLRDRYKEQTQKEYREFLKFIKERFYSIIMKSCTIEGASEKESEK